MLMKFAARAETTPPWPLGQARTVYAEAATGLVSLDPIGPPIGHMSEAPTDPRMWMVYIEPVVIAPRALPTCEIPGCYICKRDREPAVSA